MIILSCLTILVLALFFKSLWSYSAIEQTQMTDHLNEIQERSLTNALSKPLPAGRPNLKLVVSSITTHQCPPDGSGIMPCCGKTPFEVSPSDRMTSELNQVTCSSRDGLDNV